MFDPLTLSRIDPPCGEVPVGETGPVASVEQIEIGCRPEKVERPTSVVPYPPESVGPATSKGDAHVISRSSGQLGVS